MHANASSFEALHCSITNFVGYFTFRNAVSNNIVIGALQGHIELAQPSRACAAAKIEKLIATGQIEFVKSICRLNACLVASSQTTDRGPPTQSTTSSKKNCFLLTKLGGQRAKYLNFVIRTNNAWVFSVVYMQV